MKQPWLQIDCQSCGSSQEVDLRDALLIIAQCLAETAESGSRTGPDGGPDAPRTTAEEPDPGSDDLDMLLEFLEPGAF